MCKELTPTTSVPCLPSSGCRIRATRQDPVGCEGLGLLGVFLLILKTANQPPCSSTQAGRMGEEPSPGGGAGPEKHGGTPWGGCGPEGQHKHPPRHPLHLPHRPGAARGRGWRAPEVHSRAAIGHQTLDDIILTP